MLKVLSSPAIKRTPGKYKLQFDCYPAAITDVEVDKNGLADLSTERFDWSPTQLRELADFLEGK